MVTMSSTSVDATSVDAELVDVGNKLYKKNLSIAKLMIFLGQALSVLEKVPQKPPQHTIDALFLIMTALMEDKFLKHSDLNVQVAIASCFNELTRITAPLAPYLDKQMKGFIKLVNIALKQLSCEPRINLSRALRILETMAKAKSGVLMMDIDPSLVVETFQIIFNVISWDHDVDVYEYMEMVMTSVIEESKEIPFELLSPLLDSVKMEKKYKLSWTLGKKVFAKCSTQLKPYVKEAFEKENLDLDDYDKVVTSLCKDTSKRVENGGTVLETEQEDSDPQSNDENENIVHSEMDTRARRSKRQIKPTYKLRPDEIHDHPSMKMDLKKEKKKKSRRPYAENLVNSKIQVWWPKDKMFYKGIVIAYDDETKKHTIFYDDDDIEILNLEKETWELVYDNRSRATKPVEEQDVVDRPAPSKEPVKLKDESCDVAKSGEISAPDIVYVDDEPNDEGRETNVSTKDEEECQVVKDESGNDEQIETEATTSPKK